MRRQVIGMKLEAMFSTGDELEVHAMVEGREYVFNSSLAALVDKNTVAIKGTHIRTQLKLSMVDEIRLVSKRNNSGIIMVSGRVLKTDLDSDGINLVIEVDSELQQIQRRQFFRLPLYREIEMMDGQHEKHQGVTQNISAGGMRCLMTSDTIVGDRVKIKMNLNDDILEMWARVLEVGDLDDMDRRCVVRVCFEEIDEKTRSKLISYIMKEQSRMNRYRI